MTDDGATLGLTASFRHQPLQAAKFAFILLAVGLALAGFVRLIDAGLLVEGPLLGDGQFLALVLLPVVSLALVVVVAIETAVDGYRSLRSDRPLDEQVSGNTGYLLVRGAEAGVAVAGVAIMAAAVPALVAPSTPGPAGVGIMLLLFLVGLAMLGASFVRASAELFVYRKSSG